MFVFRVEEQHQEYMSDIAGKCAKLTDVASVSVIQSCTWTQTIILNERRWVKIFPALHPSPTCL